MVRTLLPVLLLSLLSACSLLQTQDEENEGNQRPAVYSLVHAVDAGTGDAIVPPFGIVWGYGTIHGASGIRLLEARIEIGGTAFTTVATTQGWVTQGQQPAAVESREEGSIEESSSGVRFRLRKGAESIVLFQGDTLRVESVRVVAPNTAFWGDANLVKRYSEFVYAKQ